MVCLTGNCCAHEWALKFNSNFQHTLAWTLIEQVPNRRPTASYQSGEIVDGAQPVQDQTYLLPEAKPKMAIPCSLLLQSKEEHYWTEVDCTKWHSIIADWQIQKILNTSPVTPSGCKDLRGFPSDDLVFANTPGPLMIALPNMDSRSWISWTLH
jgi:hypothetical protein